MNQSQRLITFFIICMLLVTGCQRQTLMAEELTKPFQEMLEQQRQQIQILGMSAAVILPDGTIWLGVSGKSSDSEAMNSDMLSGLASVSKTYTAALVVQLEAEGLLSVDDPIGKWIPDLGRIDRNIPLRLLLNHTSGLYRYQQKPEFLAAVSAQPERIWKPWEILQEFQGEPECQPGLCPGESFGESAMDYVLLGMVIEKATGSTVSSQLTSRFFKPLGLVNTFLYPEQVYPIKNMAHMWWDINGTGQPVDVTASVGPQASLWSGLWTSGAIHATAEDLARFTKSLFEGKVISPEALKEMLTPGPELAPDTHYGYSVVIEKIDGKIVYWHTGGFGYASVYFYVPEDGISIAVLGNLMVDLKPTALALYEAYGEHQK